MNMPSSSPITQLLLAAGQGNDAAHNELWSLIYDDLRAIAQRQMAKESPGRTLQPTALVNEAYMRLVGGVNVEWSNRRHFFAAAARAMQRICIDDARKRGRHKRGGGQKPGPLIEDPAILDDDPSTVLAIDEALRKLEKTDARKAEIVMLRYFAGLSVDECAAALGLSARTIMNEWRLARTWLYRELGTER